MIYAVTYGSDVRLNMVLPHIPLAEESGYKLQGYY